MNLLRRYRPKRYAVNTVNPRDHPASSTYRTSHDLASYRDLSVCNNRNNLRFLAHNSRRSLWITWSKVILHPDHRSLSSRHHVAVECDSHSSVQNVSAFCEHCANTRWFKYDRDYLCVNKSQFVLVIFEPPCTTARNRHRLYFVCTPFTDGLMLSVHFWHVNKSVDQEMGQFICLVYIIAKQVMQYWTLKTLSLHTMKAYRGSISTASLIFYFGTKLSWMVSFASQPLCHRERTPVPNEKEAGWATELVWTFWRDLHRYNFPVS